MRSIRLSLTVYIVALVGVALGAVSALVYRNAEQTLQDKNKAAREALEARFREDRNEKVRRLDHALLQQARTIAQMTQFQKDEPRIREAQREWEKWNERWRKSEVFRHLHFASGLLATAGPPTPATFASFTFWTSEATKRWNNEPKGWWFPLTVHQAVMANIRTQIRVPPTALPLLPVEEGITEYFQVNSPWGNELRSDTLKGRRFDIGTDVFSPNAPPIDLGWEDVLLEPDLVVRRVTLLTPMPRLMTGTGTGRAPTSPTWNGRGWSSPPPAPRTDPLPRPTILVQYACDRSGVDLAIAQLVGQRDAELERVGQESAAALGALRNELLLIIGCAFVALILGAYVMVRVGLAPLHRLSEAVSRVSEKDFQLQLGDQPLPHELRPIAERLTQTLGQLQHAFGREKQATADISHELRTPLAALTTTIDVTLRKNRSAEEYREALLDCRTSATQINQAVERLLALARLDAGVDRLRKQTIDAVDVARQCVSVVRPLAEVHGLKLSLESEAPALIDTDPDKLREILNNLLHNAVQYNRPDGSIDVAVHRQNGHLTLQVRDTGVGIPPAARPHIFERFYRADPSRQTDNMNAGLGLAIVKGYLDLMGGSIEVESTEGQGSTFSIQLPA